MKHSMLFGMFPKKTNVAEEMVRNMDFQEENQNIYLYAVKL